MPKRLYRKRFDDGEDETDPSDEPVDQDPVRESVHGVLQQRTKPPLSSDDMDYMWGGEEEHSCEEGGSQMELFEEDESLTPLMMAVSRGDANEARYLVKNGDDVNAKGIDGETALFIAIINGNRELVTELIALGADVNQPKEDGMTPLMEALYSNASSHIVFFMVDILLKCGADPDYKSEESDDTPRQYALEDDRPEIRLLFERRAGGNSAPGQPNGIRSIRDRMTSSLKEFKN